MPCRRTRISATALALCLTATPAAFAACTIKKRAELAAHVIDSRVLIDGQINGRDSKILVDTGSQISFISQREATRLGLKTSTVNMSIHGAGGKARALETVVQELRFGPFADRNLRLLVIAPQPGRRQGAAALVLGADFFGNFATEFDLAHDAIRLLTLEGCKPDQVAYWTVRYSMADLHGGIGEEDQIRSDVLINGRRVDAILDTGATHSVISPFAARAAGVDPLNDGAQPVGHASGVAGVPLPIWTGTFSAFQFGDEAIRNVKLQIADLFAADAEVATGSHVRKRSDHLPELLLGADFFRAHRILVIPREHKLVFTYNGGPIFEQMTQPAR